MSTNLSRKFAAVLFPVALVALGACAPTGDGSGPDPYGTPVAGHAFLKVVGDRDVFMDAGTATALTIRYEDDYGEPLAGEVSFAILGNSQGGVLSRATAVTDATGIARIVLNAGATDEAAFRIVASAAVADAVDWRVAVTAVQPVIPLATVGTFDVSSRYELTGGLPAAATDALRTIVEMTDDVNDPAAWLLDRALEGIDSGFALDVISNLRPALDAQLNHVILTNAPDFVATLVEFGDELGQVARKFGVASQLDISAVTMPDAALVGRHAITGVTYTIDEESYDFTAAELELGASVAQGIAVQLIAGTRVEFGEHTLPFDYGQMLAFAVDRVIIPRLDPSSSDLGDLLASRVNCHRVGDEVYEAVVESVGDLFGLISSGLIESACVSGIDAAANAILEQLTDVGGAGSALVIQGDVRVADTNLDHKVDALRTGLWAGVLHLAGGDAPLVKPHQTFTGTRRGVN